MTDPADGSSKDRARIRSVTNSLLDKLLDDIRAGTLKPGTRLPPEREIVESHSIPRSAVRSVFDNLEKRGFLTRTVGRGTYVAAPQGASTSNEPAASTFGDISPADLIRARSALEPGISELVTLMATIADHERMTYCVEQSEKSTTVDEFDHWDGEFHQAIAAATHNKFVVYVFNTAHEIRHQSEWSKLKVRSVTPQRRKVYEKDHRDILNALIDRDGPRAKLAIERHLRNIRRFLLGE